MGVAIGVDSHKSSLAVAMLDESAVLSACASSATPSRGMRRLSRGSSDRVRIASSAPKGRGAMGPVEVRPWVRLRLSNRVAREPT